MTELHYLLIHSQRTIYIGKRYISESKRNRKQGVNIRPLLYQLRMSLNRFFNPLRLNPNIPLRDGGGTVL